MERIGLDSKVSIFMRDGKFSTISGILNVYLSKGTQWVRCNEDSFFDSHGCLQSKEFLFV